MTGPQGARTGRSREELLAAAAALTAVVHETDDDALAASLAERARQLEDESLDAPPIVAAAEISDVNVVHLIGFLWASAAASTLGTAGVPAPVAKAVGVRLSNQTLDDPLIRDELVTSARHALAGRCGCGAPRGEDHQHGKSKGGGQL